MWYNKYFYLIFAARQQCARKQSDKCALKSINRLMIRELTHLQTKWSYLRAKEMESLHKMSRLGYFMIVLKRKKQGQENNAWLQNKIQDYNSAEVCWPHKAQRPNSNSSWMTMNDWIPAPVFQLKSGCNINQ